MEQLSLGFLGTALVVLLLLSCFFSISETAMMAINRYRLQSQVRQGKRSARLVAAMLQQTDRMLGMILLGNNAVNILAASVSTVISIRMFGDNEWALGVANATLTGVVLIFCEATPKVLAARFPEPIAHVVVYALTFLLRVLSPLVWLINLLVNGLIRLLRLDRQTGNQQALSADDVKAMLHETGHFIPQQHRKMLFNLFDLEQITVDDVMTPRQLIEGINIAAPAEQVRQQLATAHHTRLPVYRGDPANVIGVVHLRKVLHLLQHKDFTPEDLCSVMREPYFIPAGTPLFSQLQGFQEHRRRIALVVDEYGELQGLVTLENILEEIVGEFTTQAPTQLSGYQKHPEGGVIVEGGVNLRDLNRRLGTTFPLDGPKTLNGLMLEYLEHIPEAGTCMRIGRHALEILQTQDRRIRSVRVYPVRDGEGG